ncbi:MAG: site-specific DNA-methyltransferase [Sphaerospermopsis kisseleviana]
MNRQDVEKVEITSGNINAEQIKQLKAIFPEVFTEGEIDFAKLQATLGKIIDDRPERYSFTWAGKREAIQVLQASSRGTLKPERSESVDFDSTQNLFIEGDNLEVLKLLRKSYAGQVKMIYIDPPYNTGNDFIYPDNYTDALDNYLELTGQKDSEGNLQTSNPETSGRYHSAWLSMMYPRLFLARQLLRDDGVIFVSIDDHEVHNLRLLMNEIFGEENLLGNIANINNPKGRSDDKFIATAHEYLLVYAKNKNYTYWNGFEPDEKVLVRYNKEDEKGKFREIDLRKTGDEDLKEDRPEMFYYFYYNSDNIEKEQYIEQLELFSDPLIDSWQSENVIYEVILKEGYSLTSRIEKITEIASANILKVTDEDKGQHFYISLDHQFHFETARQLKLTKDDLLICRDMAIDDTTAANLMLQCRLKTI